MNTPLHDYWNTILRCFLLSNDLKTLPKKKFYNAHKNTEVLIAIDADSREKVDEMVKL
jgi:predicted lactoylglutathione lyase